MKAEKHIRELAVSYFEGRISGPEEKRLFAYICQDETCLHRFKEWEKVWAAAGQAAEETQKEWLRLQHRVYARESVVSLLATSAYSSSSHRKKRFTLKKRAAVAAIACLTIGLSFGIWKTAAFPHEKSYFTCEAPYGEKSRLVLSDGTIVWLNAGSTLRYADDYNASDRKVLLEGEGYFEVTRQKGIPFIVETKAYKVVVKGTKFTVSAYKEDGYVATTLLEGAVVLDYKGKEIALSPGESMRLDLKSGRFTRATTEAAQSKAWADNRIEFDQITLQELLTRLSRQYNVPIHLLSRDFGEQTYSISLRNRETIDEVLTAIEQIIPIKVERREKDIYIR